MKKIFFYIMFAVAGLSLQSCLHDDDEIFDKSAAERINEAVANAKEVLTSSQEGWVMHYYAGREYAYGGLNLAMKFTDGKVQMYNETAKNPDDSYKSVVSTYTVSYTHPRAHETGRNLVCRLLLEKKQPHVVTNMTSCHRLRRD